MGSGEISDKRKLFIHISDSDETRKSVMILNFMSLDLVTQHRIYSDKEQDQFNTLYF